MIISVNMYGIPLKKFIYRYNFRILKRDIQLVNFSRGDSTTISENMF
jgi:hypothetical protein